MGRAIVRFLSASGFDVAFTYCTRGDDAMMIEHEIEQGGKRALALKADFAGDLDMHEILKAVKRQVGNIGLLVMSASTFPQEDIINLQDHEIKRIFRVNVENQYLFANSMAKTMKAEGKGRIIFILGTAGEKIFSRYLPYSIGKAACYAMVRGMAKAFAPEVSVNGVSPGIITPPDFTTEGERDYLLKKIPAGNFGVAEDVARTVLFLADAPMYITGEVIGVDGGYGL